MKKKVFILLIVMFSMCFMNSVGAANIKGCETIIPGAVIDVKIPNAVHTIITVIKIAVPVLLVIFGMMDLFKGITAQKEDEIKKGQQILIKRIVVAAIIFFVVSIVQLLISFVAGDSEPGLWDCVNCFLRGADSSSGVCNK